MATLQNTTIPDAGTIGSVSDPDAISISSGGVVSTSAGLDVSSGTLTTSTAQKQAISATAFASGTKMVFNQTAAPTGWTKVTGSGNDHALRVVTGTVGTGGSVDFTTAFASQSIAAHTLSADSCTLAAHTISVSGHTLATSEMPSHTHSYFNKCNRIAYGFIADCHAHCLCCGRSTGSTGGGGSHTHGVGGSQTHEAHTHAFSGAQTHADLNLAVKYVDIIIAEKD